MKGRGGFTFIELTIATAILSAVAVAVTGAMIGSMRILRKAYAEAESSVVMRQQREWLLFHQGYAGITNSTGFIAATNVVIGGNGRSASAGVASLIRRPLVSTVPDVHDGWLQDTGGEVARLPGLSIEFDDGQPDGKMFFVNLVYTNGLGFARRERMMVPKFGAVQDVYGSGSVREGGGL